MFSSSLLYSAPQIVGPINFGKGLNLQATESEIQDNQSKDMCDCISNTDGTLDERFGNKLYIDQALSSQPVKNLYRAYASSGTITRKVTLAVNGTRIVYSTDDINPQWITITTNVHPNQNWSFVTMNNEIIMTGDGLIDPISRFNILTSSYANLFTADTSTESIVIRAKYLVQKSNYLLFLNCADVTSGTTYYASRVYYSLLNTPSSTTYNRFFDVRTNDGEELTGGGVMLDRVNLFKQSSIHDLFFTVLNLVSLGGDQQLSEIVNGFGLKAPRTLQNLGLFYVLGSQDSIRLWDGGRRSRINFTEESKPISSDIKILVDRLIKEKTYENMICKYYKKREWLIFSYEDKNKFPKGRNNSVIIYDLKIGQWYPFCGITAESFETADFSGDDGTLIYGDSNDGLVYKFDQENTIDDSPKQIVVDTMDSTASWRGTNFNVNFVDYVEGTGSVRMWINPTITNSSVTSMRTLNLGEFYDKTKVIKTTDASSVGDKIQFKVASTSYSNITNLRIDLEVNDIDNTVFDSNFTSITLTSTHLLSFSSAVVRGTTWSIVEIPLSSFTILPTWTSFETENIPFADTLFYYGLRFSVTGVDVSSISIDDVRVVQEKNPINFYRFTKLFDFLSANEKTLGQILLTSDRPRDSSLSIDIYNDFGNKIKTEEFQAEVPKEIIVFGLVSTASIAILDDLNFKIKRSTVLDINEYYPLNGVADNKHIYFSDRTNNRLVKMDRNTFVVVSTFGGLGSGTTNFNTLHQHDLDENNRLYGVDLGNQRIKVHSINDLSFINQTGSLGNKTTSYHQPTGITVNKTEALIADEGNYRWKKVNISTLGFIISKTIDQNTIGDTSLEQDSEFYYSAYNKISDEFSYYQDVFMEKRFKGNLDLINRIKIRPNDSVNLSTISISGDIGMRGNYIYIVFADNFLSSVPDYYIQKRLKSNFSLISQLKTSRRIFSVLGDPFSHKPSLRNEKKDLGTGARYIQIKFYDSGSDNRVKLINQSFILEEKPTTY